MGPDEVLQRSCLLRETIASASLLDFNYALEYADWHFVGPDLATDLPDLCEWTWYAPDLE